MTKDEALDLALEVLEYIDLCDNDRDFLHPHECFQLDKAITAIKQARALDKKADNARELGLDYEPVDWEAIAADQAMTIALLKSEAAAQPAPVQEPVAVVSGYYGGQCVVLPTNPARLFNSGTAFYTTPPAAPVQEPVADAMARYLRVCSSGGMPKKLQESVQNLVYDAERLGYFKAATPPAAPVPEMVFVPYEPCVQMQEQGSAASDYDLSQSRSKRVYQAMLDMHQSLKEKGQP